jgi:hypothetical protein
MPAARVTGGVEQAHQIVDILPGHLIVLRDPK